MNQEPGGAKPKFLKNEFIRISSEQNNYWQN